MSLLFLLKKFSLLRFSAALLLVLLGAAGARAVPLSEYKSRVEEAVAELYQLSDEEDEQGVTSDRARRRAATFERIRKLLPTEETVEWAGVSVRVDNSWLEEELKKYEQLPVDDPRREDSLYGIADRLSALDERLSETAARGTRAGLDKEQQKPQLEAILRRAEYNDKPAEKGALARFWERVKQWWNSLLPSINPLQPGGSWLSFFVMLFIFALAGGLILYVTLKLASVFRSRSPKGLGLERRGTRFVLGERLGPEQTAASLLNEAEELARRGEVRAAIRKGYVALLCELGERKVITLAGHKTNHDYLRAVREQRPLLNEMQKLTASFENHWYGFVPASPDDWSAFRTGYQQTLKTASLLKDEG